MLHTDLQPVHSYLCWIIVHFLPNLLVSPTDLHNMHLFHSTMFCIEPRSVTNFNVNPFHFYKFSRLMCCYNCSWASNVALVKRKFHWLAPTISWWSDKSGQLLWHLTGGPVSYSFDKFLPDLEYALILNFVIFFCNVMTIRHDELSLYDIF